MVTSGRVERNTVHPLSVPGEDSDPSAHCVLVVDVPRTEHCRQVQNGQHFSHSDKGQQVSCSSGRPFPKATGVPSS